MGYVWWKKVYSQINQIYRKTVALDFHYNILYLHLNLDEYK